MPPIVSGSVFHSGLGSASPSALVLTGFSSSLSYCPLGTWHSLIRKLSSIHTSVFNLFPSYLETTLLNNRSVQRLEIDVSARRDWSDIAAWGEMAVLLSFKRRSRTRPPPLRHTSVGPNQWGRFTSSNQKLITITTLEIILNRFHSSILRETSKKSLIIGKG